MWRVGLALLLPGLSAERMADVVETGRPCLAIRDLAVSEMKCFSRGGCPSLADLDGVAVAAAGHSNGFRMDAGCE